MNLRAKMRTIQNSYTVESLAYPIHLRRWCNYDVLTIMMYQNLRSNARRRDLEKGFTEVKIENFSFR